jgi:hypothetical protein
MRESNGRAPWRSRAINLILLIAAVAVAFTATEVADYAAGLMIGSHPNGLIFPPHSLVTYHTTEFDYASGEGTSPEASDQCPRRSNQDEPVLARQLPQATLLGPCGCVLRAQRRCEAGDLAFSCLGSSTNVTVNGGLHLLGPVGRN